MVPIVSKRSMKRKVSTTTSISQLSMLAHSNLQKIGATLSGSDTSITLPASLRIKLVMASPVAGSLITSPSKVVARIPISIPPLTLSMTRPAVMAKPIRLSRAVPLVMSPRLTRVASLLTMMPAFCIPMNAMNRPIPAPIAFLSVPGMAPRSHPRRPVMDMIMKINPSMSTAVSANCQL